MSEAEPVKLDGCYLAFYDEGLENQGVSFTRLTDETLGRLDTLLPTVQPHDNPVNIRADATGERDADVPQVLIAVQEVGTILEWSWRRTAYQR